mmetsp:Transcript_3692/g.7843  ORF Transcript_3692/g.7843 Transcript_3692/m.7843 type:complete len:888 (+) Transcript_3692:263-2926(+)
MSEVSNQDIDDVMLNEPSSSSASESMEKDGENFLQNLTYMIDENPSLLDPQEFKSQYEILLGALKLAHARESSLVKQCQELHTQKVAGAAELQAARRASRGSQLEAESSKKDLGALKSVLQAANGREEQAKATIAKLKEELERLTDQMDRSEIAAIRKENEAKRLAKDVEHWKDQADAAAEKMEMLQVEQQKAQDQMEHFQKSYKDIREHNHSLRDRLSEKDGEIKKCLEQNEKLEKELKDAQRKLEVKTKQFIDTQYSAAVARGKVTSLEKQLAEEKNMIAAKEQELKEQVSLKQKVVTLLDEQKRKTNVVSEEFRQLQLEQKRLLLERNKLSSENTQLSRNLEAERKAIQRQQQLIDDANAAARIARDESEVCKKEIDAMKKREDQFNNEVMLLKRENGLQLGRVQQTEDELKKTGRDLLQNEQIMASVEKELAEARDAAAKQLSLNRRLESDCDGLRNQVTESRASCERLMDEIKIRETQAKELTREIEALEGKLDQQKQEYDAIRAERNDALRQLTDSRSEVDILEDDQKNLKREIATFKSELATKDSALVKENFDCRKERAQKEMLVDEVARLKKMILSNEDNIKTLELDVRQMNSTIRKLDETALLQRKEYDQIIYERDILGTQLIRRNDELALLYEKVKILQGILRRGELQYNSRLEDIRLLKLKIRDLQRQLHIAKGGQENVDDLSRNLIQAQKDLLKEKVKVEALTDELENPMNVHRWRKLEGSDPDAYEMIQKIHILQKRLLLKTEEVVKKNSSIQEQEERRIEIEKNLARRPGPDVVEQMNSYQQDVKKKSKQMKAMASELNMHQAQVNEYKREIDKMSTELNDYKRKYFEQKRREALAQEKEMEIMSELSLDNDVKPNNRDTTKTRFLGGGFAVK